MGDLPSGERKLVLAACGCGHDGRLGFGDPLHPQAVLSASRVTLLPFFLEALPSSGDSIKSVHSGAYHTLVLTENGVLYGWGLHENGQLGLGKLSREGAQPCQHSPVRISFFDDLFRRALQNGEINTSRKEFILDVQCGASHSMVLTQLGLYVCGQNTFGQLGLGSEKDVFEWHLLDSLFGGRTLLCRKILPATESESLVFSSSSRQKRYVRILKGELTHVSCGTHHSLLAFKDAFVEVNADTDAMEQVMSEFHPVLLVAAGKGDYGELGYDGDALSVLHAQEKRQGDALGAEAKRVKMQGGVNSDNNEHGPTLPSTAYSNAWWAKQRRKDRRPDFFSTHFLPIKMSCWEHLVIRLPRAFSSLVEEELSHTLERRTPALRDEKWVVQSLHAMHLHSAVILHHVEPAAKAKSSSPTPSDNPASQQLWHWGCYYCNEVEGLESSIPRREEWDSNESSHLPEPFTFGIHAGNEVMFRYRDSKYAINQNFSPVMVKGSGPVLGIGEEDGFQPNWVPLSLPSTTQSWLSVTQMQGRNHILMLVQKENSEEGKAAEVWGFGENLHGQLACEETDLCVSPYPVLRRGDTVSLPSSSLVAVPHDLDRQWKVMKIHGIAAGANHSLFLIDLALQ